MFNLVIVYLGLLSTMLSFAKCSDIGPDPWDYKKTETSSSEYSNANNVDIPPDLRIPNKKKYVSDSNMQNGEWFFKRTLAIMLNGGQTKINDDGIVDISIHLTLEPERWQTLNEYTKSNMAMTEDMFRRAIAYVEEAIYKPTVSEEIVMAWSEYVQTYIQTYKTHIVWCFGILAATGLIFWLCKHMSYKHVIILIILAMYVYEVIISYKEAEKEELEKFVSALNKCSWYFWKSTCEVPSPDPILFMNHMNPLKIGVRMFTTILCEPIIALSATVNTMVQEITDKMWFPFNVIVQNTVVISINFMLILLLMMVIFNFILNIPFDFNFLLGSLRIRQRKRTINFDTSNNNIAESSDNNVKISSATLEKILDIVSRSQGNSKNAPRLTYNKKSHLSKHKKPSNVGLPANYSLDNTSATTENSVRKRSIASLIGGGDGKQNGKKGGWLKGRFRGSAAQSSNSNI